MSDLHELVRVPQPCIINPEDPWDGDLGRRQFAANLTRLLTGARTPLVVSIEGSWGTGKSTFVQRWTADLQKLPAHTIVLNAWAASTHDTPRTALFGEMIAVVRAITNTACPDVARTDELVAGVEAIATTFKEVLKSSLDVLTKGVLNADVQDAASDAISALQGRARLTPRAIDESLDAYNAHRECYDRFTQLLGEIAGAIRGSNGLPLIFIIDELDRCRPDFALEMLECLRHLFASTGIVFVLSIDASQLESSLKCVYGSQLDVDRYLRRVFDIRLPLPRPQPRELAVAAVRATRVNEVIRSKWDDQVTSDLIGYLARLIMAYDLDIRTTERLVADFCTCAMVASSDIHPTNLINLLTLRARSRDMFGLVQDRRDHERVLEFWLCANPAFRIDDTDPYQCFLADLYRHMLPPELFAAKLAELQAKEGTAAEAQHTRGALAVVVDRMRRNGGSIMGSSQSPLKEYIDLINMNVPFSRRL